MPAKNPLGSKFLRKRSNESSTFKEKAEKKGENASFREVFELFLTSFAIIYQLLILVFVENEDPGSLTSFPAPS